MPSRPFSPLRWGERTYVMGILNVTADSFSGDGLAVAGRSEAEVVAAALELARGFVAAGADILDVGGESSRPAAVYGEHPAIDAEEETRLTLPVVEALVAEFGERVLVSIDTSKGSVARAALSAGAGMVNDVWAARRVPGTAEAAAEAGAYLVVMHNKDVAEYPDGLLPEVIEWLRTAAEAAAGIGVRADRLLVDPGIGFGKTRDHNLEILNRLAELKTALGLPLLIGTSRKRFIGEILDGAPASDRLEGTAASVVLAIASGADVVRVHDVAPIVRAVRVADAIVRKLDKAPAASPPAATPGWVSIRDIQAQGRHGVGDAERSLPQPFEVDVAVAADFSAAAATDRLEDTVDYAALQTLVMTRVRDDSFHLIESLAASIGQAILDRWPVVTEVEVAVRKPEASLPGPAGGAEVRLRLQRAREPRREPARESGR
ncbi:MAG TPA: dihydropteroate synthase [Pleomorphomonadaceae bacterium]|nr:dihydropteroate synthase [Pleomorphomonadaceae bacterium]